MQNATIGIQKITAIMHQNSFVMIDRGRREVGFKKIVKICIGGWGRMVVTLGNNR